MNVVVTTTLIVFILNIVTFIMSRIILKHYDRTSLFCLFFCLIPIVNVIMLFISCLQVEYLLSVKDMYKNMSVSDIKLDMSSKSDISW